MDPMKRCLLPLLLLLTGCPTGSEPVETPDPTPEPEPEWPVAEPGALVAGASRGSLELPVGLPLAGFTGRDRSFGGDPGPDARDSDYTTDFQASGGWQTDMPVQALWLSDGARHAVIVRLDLIYSYDDLTEEIGRRLTEATGIDLTDSVFTTTSHSHSSPGTFTNATIFFLGSDMYSEEIFSRVADQATEQALAAYERLEPARIGLGIDEAFDPIPEGAIFRDRRSENDHLLGPGGILTGEGWKDERASLLRVDAVDGDPIAALFAFGIHGTIMGGSNALASTEAGGHIGALLNERYGGPVWMFAQGAGGDASPAGRHSEFARMEYLAEVSAERILSLYEATTTSDDPVVIEPVQRYVPQNRDVVRVTRGGTVDLHYEPYQPEWSDAPPYVDEELYDLYGEVASPLDEFWARHGAALCGNPSISIPTFGLDVEHPAYKSCITMESGYVLFRIAFSEYFQSEEEDWQLPLPDTASAMLGALGLRSIPVTTLSDDGSNEAVKDVALAFAPGEPTTLWTQFLRARAAEEAGVPEVVVLGYAMDHEGYLLTTEDWLLAGYEPSITIWGPLQGEYLLERFVDLLPLATSPALEDPDWPDWPGETPYPERSIPTVVPDDTPDAGTTPPEVPELTWVRPGQAEPSDVQPASTLRRMQDNARFVFWGNDPAMGNPRVIVEREVGADVWEPLVTPAGNPVSDAMPDLIVTYTPLPLFGSVDEPDPVRQHLYVAEWQAVETWAGLESAPGLPLGRYRLHASGSRRDPSDTEPPFDGVAWDLASEPFEVVPATVEVQLDEDLGEGIVVLRARYAAPPAGYRLLHLDRDRHQTVPLVPAPGGLIVSDSEPLPATTLGEEGGWTRIEVDLSGRAGVVEVTLDDGFGNEGGVTLDLGGAQ